jgi:hypothetical protein
MKLQFDPMRAPNSQHNWPSSQHLKKLAALEAESPRNKQEQLCSPLGFLLKFGTTSIKKRINRPMNSKHPFLPSRLRVNQLP